MKCDLRIAGAWLLGLAALAPNSREVVLPAEEKVALEVQGKAP